MAWDHLSINKPHLVYIILGGFTTLFMLCSSVIKERLYIGEATVATLCGIIFGPHAADLINPLTWGNTDQITLEFSRVVLVVQCFAVGVELPKYYMERHWKSVVLLLVPVMTFGWLITSLFIWGLMGEQLDWLDSLTVAACVTATDPVLASSVVGKGKFAKRVPKHLRDLLSAESGCNDGMAFPFIYLAIYLLRYRPDAAEVTFHWFCFTILYECIFGAVYGVIIGYIARRAIRAAHERDLIDRESFLVFYFVLALFCAGSGSLLGMDDLLIGFACGVGFSNDGWFLEKTEESHVSNVIDLLINLAFFVYFGTIIPWQQYNSVVLGTTPWRLVVIAILVILFRRIPIMLALKAVIPDVKTWREALFAGHFGPIGVGALYVAILARAELETEDTTPLAVIPEPGFEHLNVIELVWPITTFLVIASIVVHGSSIAVFTLGKHINTLTISMSYTQGNEEGYSWMERLPRIQSRSKSSMSLQQADSEEELEEKLPTYPAATLPKNFLRRQKEDDGTKKRVRPFHKTRQWDSGMGPGGPISESAISPRARTQQLDEGYELEKSESSTIAMKSEASPESSEDISPERRQPRVRDDDDEISPSTKEDVIKDGRGAVLDKMESKRESAQEREEKVEQEVKDILAGDEYVQEDNTEDTLNPTQVVKNAAEEAEGKTQEAEESPRRGSRWNIPRSFGNFKFPSRQQDEAILEAQKERKKSSGPARAFRFGRTIIVEDEDGEVIKKFDIPAPEQKRERKQSYIDPATRQRLQRVGTWLGINPEDRIQDDAAGEEEGETSGAQAQQRQRRASAAGNNDEDDEGLRFRMDGNSRRMSKAEFIKQIQALDPKLRAEVVEDSGATEAVKKEVKTEADERARTERRPSQPGRSASSQGGAALGRTTSAQGGATLKKTTSNTLKPSEAEKQTRAPSRSPSRSPGASQSSAEGDNIPTHDISTELRLHSNGSETAAQRRRRLASMPEEDSDDDGTPRVPPSQRTGGRRNTASSPPKKADPYEGETAAERRRREGALGLSKEESDSDEDETQPRQPPKHAVSQAPASVRAPGIRFAEQPPKQGGPSVKWGSDRGRKK